MEIFILMKLLEILESVSKIFLRFCINNDIFKLILKGCILLIIFSYYHFGLLRFKFYILFRHEIFHIFKIKPYCFFLDNYKNYDILLFRYLPGNKHCLFFFMLNGFFN